MGGGNSVFEARQALTETQWNDMTPSYRMRFQAHGEHLVGGETSGKMSDLELHMALTLYYSKLMEELRTRDYNLSQSVMKLRKEDELAAKQQARTEAQLGWNADADAKKKLDRRRELFSKFSTTAQQDLADISAVAAAATPSPKAALVTHDTWSASKAPTKEQEPHCKLCKKTFTFEWQLQMHTSHSKVHQANLEEKELQFAMALKRSSQLFDIVKSGAAMFAGIAGSTKQPRASETEASVPRARWKAAVGKVIQQQTYAKYQAFLSDFAETDSRSKHHPEASLLYNGTKFFWRAQQSVGIHLYLHHKHNAIEIIAQFFSDRPSSAEAPAASTPAYACAPQTSNSMSISLSSSALLHGQRVTYLYLAHNLLLAQTAGSKRDKVALDEWTRSHRGRFAKTRCTDQELEDFGNKAVVDHILGALALVGDPAARLVRFEWRPPEPGGNGGSDKSKAAASAGNLLIDPNLPCRPQGLVPARIDAVKLNQLWQVEQAMAAVQASSQDLAENVQHAERLASHLELSVSAFKTLGATASVAKGACGGLDPSSSVAKQRFRRVGARMVRVVQVAKTAARLEGIANRIAQEGGQGKVETRAESPSPKSSAKLPWTRTSAP